MQNKTTQIILLEKIANLGALGNVVKVKKGYARNFLIPQGKAKRATKENIAQFEARRTELEKIQTDKIATAQERAQALNDFNLVISQKAGVDGRLFGSVSNHDIAIPLTAAGQTVSKAEVRMPEGPFKSIGEYEVIIALHHDVQTVVKVQVTPEA